MKTKRKGTTYSKLTFFKKARLLLIQGKTVTITFRCKNKNSVYAHLNTIGYKKVTEWEEVNGNYTAKVKRI